MKENIDILGIFHDGSVIEISGALPSVSLKIEIEYLRNMFPVKGEAFIAHLSGCELIEFHDWEDDCVIIDFTAIGAQEPEILSVKEIDGAAHIICTTGELRLKYKDIKFNLDTGETVAYEELVEASNKYWDDWQSRTNI